MGFGNPYGDPWSVDVVLKWVEMLAQIEIGIISLSDTVGQAVPEDIAYLYHALIPVFPKLSLVLIFTPIQNGYEKLTAAFESGCRRFDSVINGFGGCPMASDALVGNMPTEKLVTFFNERGINTGLDMTTFESAMNKTKNLFSEYL